MTAHKVDGVRTISSHVSYHGWPTLERMRNGELWVVCSAGRERHICPFGQVHRIRSADNGQTWSGPEVLVNSPLDDRDAGILQTARGTILVNWFSSVAWLRRLEMFDRDPDRTKGSPWHGYTDDYVSRMRKVSVLLGEDTIRRELGTWVLRSTDGGRTWSERIDCGVGSPHGPTELADGRLLFVGNWRSEPADLGRKGSPYGEQLGAMYSDDDGQTWQKAGAIPFRAGDATGAYHEPHAVQTEEGRIVVHIRNHSAQDRGVILQSESSDGGATFGEPRTTGLQGFPAHLRRCRDGRLLSTFGYRVLPYGIRASVSEDGGRTWGPPMVLDEKPFARDLGYPSTVELEDGSFYSVWYENLAWPETPLAGLQAARWTIV